MKVKVHMNLFLLLITVVYILLRTLHLAESLGFGSDAGRDFLRIKEIAHEKNLTLIGPPSRFSTEGHSFYFGPAPYYLMLPVLYFGNWNVLFASYYLIFLNAFLFLGSLLFLRAAVKKTHHMVIFFFAFLVSFFPLLIETSRTYWNPYFMPGISLLVLALLVKIKNSSLSALNSLLLGFLYGLGFQFHFSYIVVILLSIAILFFIKKLSLRGFALILFGFCIGSLPLILFDLRNNFYNISVFLTSARNWKSTTGTFGLGFYYFIALIPFALYAVAYMLDKIKKVNPLFAIGLLATYLIGCFFYILPMPKSGFDMTNGWNYLDLLKTAGIIASENPTNYNIVDQLTGDNRALALRFLLSSRGQAPMDVTAYPSADYIYEFTHEPLEKILVNPVWEISSGENVNKLSEWKINENVTLYKLTRSI